MSFNTKGLMSSNDQTWKTPKKIYDYYMSKNYFDVCPSNAEFDGLSIEWHKFNFCNPPYKDIEKWVDKAIKESALGKSTLFLIPSRTDTQWFKKLARSGARFIFIEGRLKFNDCKVCAPFPSMFVRLNPYCNMAMCYYDFDMDYMTKSDLNERFNIC